MVAEQVPTAAFVASDEMAFGVLKVLRKAGLDVPRDFSVLGFDNHELCGVVDLTTMDHDVAEQGQDAARILLEVLNGRSPAAIVRPVRLVVRGTTAPPRALRLAAGTPDSPPSAGPPAPLERKLHAIPQTRHQRYVRQRHSPGQLGHTRRNR
ncbi:substrate-binding domain-containing protein [Arthrobacter sp. B2I5]|uniref:substrate-binding domain-containing protein n=1 Tax=Arthrobacter sp. B2I5 TaxID=3042266 RepID=UPI00358EE76F